MAAQSQSQTKIVFGIFRRNVDKILPDVRTVFQRVVNRTVPIEHNVSFFMDAETRSDGAIEGRIFFFPYKNAKRVIKELDGEIKANAAARFTVARAWLERKCIVSGLGTLSCSFTLLRNGKIFIENDANIHPQIFATVARHLYFFVKDSVHKHYHHHGESDGILEVVDISHFADWRRVIKRNLHDKVIALRHIQDAESLSNSLGVLAYSRAFMRTFALHDFDKSGVQIPSTVALAQLSDDIESSIRLRLDAVLTNDGKRYSDASFGVGIIVAIIGIIFSWLQIADEKSRLLKVVSSRSSIDVMLAIFILGIGLWTIFDVASRKRDFNKSAIVTGIYRLLSPLDKRLHLILVNVFIVAVMILAVLTAWVLFWAFPIAAK